MPPKAFNDREYDKERGLYNIGVRQLDPNLSIFLSTDPLWEQEPARTPYHYARNNPLRITDPDGKQCNDVGEDASGKWPDNTVLDQLACLRSLARSLDIAEGFTGSLATGPITSINIRGMEVTIGLAPDNNGNSLSTLGGQVRRDQIVRQLTDGPLDGVRHALGCALTARQYGYCLTTYIAELYRESPGSKDYQMDVYNNTVGAKIGASNPDATDAEIIRLVMDSFKAGSIQLSTQDRVPSLSEPATDQNSGQSFPATGSL